MLMLCLTRASVSTMISLSTGIIQQGYGSGRRHRDLRLLLIQAVQLLTFPVLLVQCGRHQDPKFEPDLSSTFQPVKSNIDCSCDDEQKQCVYERQYAEMSTGSGVLGGDIISFGNLSELPPQRAVFGCETMETGDFYTQHADGIMGLGRGDLTIVDHLVDKGVVN